MSQFEKEMSDLIERTKSINYPSNFLSPKYKSFEEQNGPSNIWVNDFEIFYNKYLKTHALSKRISNILFSRNINAYEQLKNCLDSISRDSDFIDKMNGVKQISVPKYQAKSLPQYDVFISHANNDKEDLVEELYQSFQKLGIKIFYDKNSLEWGDNWKKKILDGTKNAEFAVIVISKNFFGREWTEKELNEFLSRQNNNGQKLILPILHGITINDLQNKYPMVADIQAIDSSNHSCDEIALMFAKQLIKRLKAY